MVVKDLSDGSWDIDLGGIAYRELYELGELLMELGDKGNISGEEYDLDSLRAHFDSKKPDVYLYDAFGACSSSNEEEE